MRNRSGTIETIIPPQTGFFAVVTRRASGLIDALLAWQDRARERRALATMDEHALQDVGLTRGDVIVEASKPFWRG